MTLSNFCAKRSSELERLHSECQRANDLDAIVVRESIAYAAAVDRPGVEWAKLRWRVAVGYARRRYGVAA